MKRVLLVLVLIMAVLEVNAQATKTTVTNAKSTRTTVKVAELQKTITDNIAKDYEGYTIKEATSITANNTVTYDVVIVKGTTTETLVYDKDGTFVKKLPQDAVKHHTTKKK
jgi:predicted Holliday junction resolvase-like endonuclease